MNIPLELVSSIAEYCDQSTLGRLCRGCKLFRYITRPFIYSAPFLRTRGQWELFVNAMVILSEEDELVSEKSDRSTQLIKVRFPSILNTRQLTSQNSLHDGILLKTRIFGPLLSFVESA
jgi:hypothetical protein